MALIKTVNGISPDIDDSAWIAENATITGNVTIGKDSGIWFQVVIRGDVNKIIIGDRVNIQDASILHGSFGQQDTFIGDDTSIGHRAIIHGCTIKGKALIGMGAIILDGAVIPENCVVAAGALVSQGKVLESGYIYAGVPAKKLKPLSSDQAAIFVDGTSLAYQKYKEWYR